MGSDKQQGSDFGNATRDLIGRNEYQPPANIADGDLAGLIGTGVNVLIGIAAGLAVVALIWGGLTWASAAGDEEKLAKAKSIITWAIVGLVMALSAWGITALAMNFFQS